MRYESLGGGLFGAFIEGDDSHVRIGDRAALAFPEGAPFGTARVLQNDGINANGLFDFAAVGLAGGWNRNVATDYTGGDVTSVSPYRAPGAVVASVPEPAPLGLVCSGLLVVAARGRRQASPRRSRRRVG